MRTCKCCGALVPDPGPNSRRWVWAEEDDATGQHVAARQNDGFGSLELLGVCALVSDDVIRQIKGIIHPTITTRREFVEVHDGQDVPGGT